MPISNIKRAQAPMGLGMIVVAMVLVSELSAQNWPMVNRSKERTSCVIHVPGFAPPFVKRASIIVPGGGAQYLSYADGVLYTGTDTGPNRIVAIEASSGRHLWSFDITGSGASCNVTPAIAGNVVFGGGQGGAGLFAVDRATGNQLWMNPIGSLYGKSPIVDGEKLYYMQDSVHCLDTRTGSSIWSYPYSASAAIATDGEAVYCTGAGSVTALHSSTGSLLWTTPVRTRSWAALSVAGGTVVTSTRDSIIALRKTDGVVVWAQSLKGREPTELASGMFAVTDSILCYAFWSDSSQRGGLAALDVHTGAEIWSYPFASRGAFTPTIVNDIAYSVNWINKWLYGLHIRTGALAFADSLDSYDFQPIFADGMLYVTTGDRIVPFAPGPSDAGPRVGPVSAVMVRAIPNPFSTSTTVHVSGMEYGNTRIFVMDLLGRRVALLFDGALTAGEHAFAWTGTDAMGARLPAGVYRACIETKSGVHSAGIFLLR